QLEDAMKSKDAHVRLGGVLAAGFRLTVPTADSVPPSQPRLFLPADNAFFKGKISYADALVDLRNSGRVGSYTTAEAWKVVPHSAEETVLVKLLRTAQLIDDIDLGALQAAYFLSLLRDPNLDPFVDSTFKSHALQRLAKAPFVNAPNVWIVGPF